MRNTKFVVAIGAALALAAAPLMTATTASSATGSNGPTGSVVAGTDYVAGVTTVSAKFKPYDNPVAKYTSKSCAIDLSGYTNGQTYTEVEGCGGKTATISIPLIKVQVGVSGWSTWASPPFVENSAPHALADYVGGQLVTVSYSAKTKTGGFELEPNDFDPPYDFTVDFYAGPDGTGKKIGSITRNVAGQAGARLFGAKSKKAFRSFVISGPPEAMGFAIAQLRGAK